jgi:hypothetical protein
VSTTTLLPFSFVAYVSLGDQFRLPYTLEVRPTAEFKYEAGKNKLVNLRLDQEGGPTVTFTIPNDILGADDCDLRGEIAGRQEHVFRLAGWIDIESRTTVCLSDECAPGSIAQLHRLDVPEHLSHTYNVDEPQPICPEMMQQFRSSESQRLRCSRSEDSCEFVMLL